MEDMLIHDPKLGSVIPGTYRARKMRFAVGEKGKSGSARVIYVDYELGEKICMLAAYTKSEKANLTEAEKKAIRAAIVKLEQIYNHKSGGAKS